jgi:hypothetical protein
LVICGVDGVLEPALARYADDFAGVYIKLKPLDIVYLLLDPVLGQGTGVLENFKDLSIPLPH